MGNPHPLLEVLPALLFCPMRQKQNPRCYHASSGYVTEGDVVCWNGVVDPHVGMLHRAVALVLS